MGDKGNRYSPRLKAEVALSAYRNDRTLSELSAEYGVSSMQIGRWKKTLSDRAAELFETGSSTRIWKEAICQSLMKFFPLRKRTAPR